MTLRQLYHSLGYYAKRYKTLESMPEDVRGKYMRNLKRWKEATGLDYQPPGDKLTISFKCLRATVYRRQREYTKKYGADYMQKLTDVERRRHQCTHSNMLNKLSAIGLNEDIWSRMFPDTNKKINFLYSEGFYPIHIVRYSLGERDAMIDRDGINCVFCDAQLYKVGAEGGQSEYGERYFMIPDTSENILTYGIKVINARENIKNACTSCAGSQPHLDRDKWPAHAAKIRHALIKRGIEL